MSQPSSYTLICGMEIHAELKTASKMFCGCKNDPFHAPEPNCYTCPVCLGMPGGLPVANKKAIEWTVDVGLALGCTIQAFSHFDRKNYFYPDLAKGYQISQYDQPFCYDGLLETTVGPVRIRRIHLEEDTGKLQHKTVDGKKVSLIDFNRSGVPLIEIVTEPDIHSAEHAKEYAKELRKILRFLGVADCDMEQGGMRLEANISLAQPGATELPAYKVELKNINSFRFMEKAIAYEIERQSQLLNQGITPTQETRGWNEATGSTFSQRSKEDAADYRYFPDPDIAPIRLSKEFVASRQQALPELPATIIARWQKDFVIDRSYAVVLTDSPELAAWADAVFHKAPQNAAGIANALVNKKIAVIPGETPLEEVVSAYESLHRTDDVDESVLAATIADVLHQHPETVAAYRAGKVQVLGFFIGQVQRSLGKKVDPKQLRDSIASQLTS